MVGYIQKNSYEAGRQCHLINDTGRREEHKMLRHHAFAR